MYVQLIILSYYVQLLLLLLIIYYIVTGIYEYFISKFLKYEILVQIFIGRNEGNSEKTYFSPRLHCFKWAPVIVKVIIIISSSRQWL